MSIKKHRPGDTIITHPLFTVSLGGMDAGNDSSPGYILTLVFRAVAGKEREIIFTGTTMTRCERHADGVVDTLLLLKQDASAAEIIGALTSALGAHGGRFRHANEGLAFANDLMVAECAARGWTGPYAVQYKILHHTVSRLGRAAAEARGLRFTGTLLGDEGVEGDIRACIEAMKRERANKDTRSDMIEYLRGTANNLAGILGDGDPEDADDLVLDAMETSEVIRKLREIADVFSAQETQP